jgi:DNA-binding XRE family transcriptional regulator
VPVKKWQREGFIYLIRAENGLVKIGATDKPRARLSTLSSGSPVPLELLHTIATNDMPWLEANLHRRFKEKRARGEWFRLTEEDLALLLAWKRWNGPASVRAARPAQTSPPRPKKTGSAEKGRIPPNLGVRLRESRIERGFSQGQLAMRARLTRKHISDLECGRGEPGLAAMLALADAMGLSLDGLVGRTPPAA